MVNDYIPIKWLFHWEYTQHFQTNPYGSCSILLCSGSCLSDAGVHELPFFWLWKFHGYNGYNFWVRRGSLYQTPWWDLNFRHSGDLRWLRCQCGDWGSRIKWNPAQRLPIVWIVSAKRVPTHQICCYNMLQLLHVQKSLLHASQRTYSQSSHKLYTSSSHSNARSPASLQNSWAEHMHRCVLESLEWTDQRDKNWLW